MAGDLQDIKTMMANLLFWYPSPYEKVPKVFSHFHDFIFSCFCIYSPNCNVYYILKIIACFYILFLYYLWFILPSLLLFVNNKEGENWSICENKYKTWLYN
jgi:hypothetical protein